MKIRSFQRKGFNPLLPVFDNDDIDSKKIFLKKKLERINRDFKFSGIDYEQKDLTDDENDLEDNLIEDDRFANVLDEERSIVVGDSIYVYTTAGIFTSSVVYESELFDLLSEYEELGVLSRNHSTRDLPTIPDNQCKNNSSGGSINLSPLTTITTPITNNIGIIQIDGCSSGGGGNDNDNDNDDNTNGDSSDDNSSDPDYAFLNRDDLEICNYDGDSLWQQVFGSAETCHDYYHSGRRVRVKMWNQNYLVFSSIGTSVKHQRKQWGIWDASDAVDFVELGVNEVSFTYDYESSHLNQIYNNYATNTLIKLNGVTYKLDGSTITTTPLTVPNWPFNSDDPLIDVVDVYVLGNDVLSGLKWKEANRLIRDTARDFIENVGNSLETSALEDNVEIRGVVIDPLSSKVQFNTVNRVERDNNDCCAYYYFDWNFFVSTKFDLNQYDVSCDVNSTEFGGSCASGGYSIDGFKVDAFNANSYEDLEVDIYGLARREGNNYRGRRIIGEE